MTEIQERRTGTIPVPLGMLEREYPWKKIAIGGISSLAFLLILSLATRPSVRPNSHDVVEQLSKTDSDAALKLASSLLVEADAETHHWREYLAINYLKAGQKEQARPHFLWLVRKFPKEASYKKGLTATTPPKKPAPPPKKKRPN